MSPSLHQFVSSIHPLPDAFWNDLWPLTERIRLPRKSILLREGQVCDTLYFIEEGLARAFYFREGEEVTTWFMQENDMIISVYSFYSQKPGYENMQLLEDSTLIALKHSSLQRLYQKHPQFNFIGRVLTEHYYTLSEERTVSLRKDTARQRYEKLLAAQPRIFQRTLLKYIASYLGVTPETISRLRAQKN